MFSAAPEQHIHFIGIGGIGISALARLCANRGASVSGSDAQHSVITDALASERIALTIGHHAANVPEHTNAVVYTTAIARDNPELHTAAEYGIPAYTYPQAIGAISSAYETIAVSGTHGKTTTTAMLAEIFTYAAYDPTVVVGSLLQRQQTNCIAGSGRYFIVEACEYRRSFLHFAPEVAVITNIAAEHLDYYRDLNDITAAFAAFINRVPEHGAIVCDPNMPAVLHATESAAAPIIDYSQYRARVPQLTVFGAHNYENAAAAYATADWCGVDERAIQSALAAFPGTWRRLEYKGTHQTGALVYDDYAHHPDEIRAAITALRQKYPRRQLHVVFQPHLYSRTKQLLSELADALAEADRVCVVPIYAAREPADPSVSSRTLVSALKQRCAAVVYAATFADVIAQLSADADHETVVVTMGAGDISQVAEQFLLY